MSGLPKITVVGRLTKDPELRFTPNGKAVANFSVATSNRRKDGDDWVDVDTSFFDCVAWERLGENAAETLKRGDEVIVYGMQRMRPWEDKDGNKRTSWEIVVEAVGPSLRWASYSKEGSPQEKREPATRSDDAPPF